MLTNFARQPSENVGEHQESIWVEFGKLAIENKAVSLGQGFPDSPAPKFVTEILKDIASHPEKIESHQYTRAFGHPDLVGILSKIYSYFYGVNVNATDDILITVGAYNALYYSFLGWISKGDEVIIIEPAFDCYFPQVKFAGGTPISVVMKLKEGSKSASQFTIDFEELEKKINKRTKMIVINNPHNPTGKLFSREELQHIAELARNYDLIVVADEVYEFHVSQPKEMIRFASLPGMYERTISIGSAGKALSVTGWKLGWAIGPQHLLSPLKTISQNCVYTCPTPIQLAIARAFQQDWPKFMENPNQSYLATGLPKEVMQKRKILANMLEKANFQTILPEAGFFMLAECKLPMKSFSFSPIVGKDPLDVQYSKWLCREKKLAVIPFSIFFSSKDQKHLSGRFVRLCFFKKDTTLQAAEKIFKTFENNDEKILERPVKL